MNEIKALVRKTSKTICGFKATYFPPSSDRYGVKWNEQNK